MTPGAEVIIIIKFVMRGLEEGEVGSDCTQYDCPSVRPSVRLSIVAKRYILSKSV